MFQMEDTTYRDLKERSLMQWLDEMERHEDPAVRGGVRLCREYIASLQRGNEQLRQENQLKNEYLRKCSKRK
ncbi:MAG: hypothetical protein IJ375_05685 [Oscillospiraceae bacterium]|nr:hypothetical protein [Oscillospiraceae bacterium]